MLINISDGPAMRPARIDKISKAMCDPLCKERRHQQNWEGKIEPKVSAT
jgi:hypothetical protein